jgi:hypothetical protein
MRMRFFFAACVVTGAAALVSTPAFSAAEESTVVSGKVFADFSNIDATNDGVDQPINGTGVDVKRFYIGVTHTFDDVWSANATTDFNYVGSDGETNLFIKKAYLQAKLNDALIGRLGSADMPWIPSAEDVYGFRFVEPTIIDRLKFGTSADWGVHGLGKVADGIFSYGVSVVNGGGYKNPTRSKSMDVEARVSFVPITGLTIMAGGYTGKLGKDIEATTTPALHTADRLDALVSYVGGALRAGAEYFQAKNWNNVTTADSDKADGYSAWASWNFTPGWGVFGRGDSAKTSHDINPDLKDEYYNAGVVAHPRKNVDLALVYKHEKVTGGGFVNSANGNLGGLQEGKYDEVGVWGQIVF